MEKQAKQCIMWYSVDLASFLFNCAKKTHFFKSVQKYYYHVQKNCLFLGPCKNITIQGQGVLGVSCMAILGVREEIVIIGEIFTSDLGSCSRTELCCKFAWSISALQYCDLLSNYKSPRVFQDWTLNSIPCICPCTTVCPDQYNLIYFYTFAKLIWNWEKIDWKGVCCWCRSFGEQDLLAAMEFCEEESGEVVCCGELVCTPFEKCEEAAG